MLLDTDAFDAWLEEDEPVLGHARDPFHRLDILPGSRTVRVELDGVVLAESTRAQLLFEGTLLPVRAYLPPADVRVPLRPSPTRTRCAYKGEAAYWSVDVHGRTVADLAWSYETPRRGGRRARRPRRLLRRARRREPRRRGRGAAAHALVLSPRSP